MFSELIKCIIFSFLNRGIIYSVVSSFLREVDTFVCLPGTGMAALIRLEGAGVSNSNH